MKVWIFAPKLWKLINHFEIIFWGFQNFWNTKNYIDFSAKIQSMLKSEKKKLKKELVNEIGVQFFTRSSKKSEPFVSCARVRQ